MEFHIQIPGVRASTKLVVSSYVWKNVRRDCANFVRNCIACQKSKVIRHNKGPVSTFIEPNQRFEHLNLDNVGPLPISRGKRYVLTCIDRFSRWPEVYSLDNISAATVARTLINEWISRFGTPLRITTDQGGQFESALFKEISSIIGVNHLRTIAYHPQANGLIER